MQWLAHVLGLDNASGHWYLLHSGIEGNLGEVAILGLIWRRVNCQAAGCWRIGMHPVAGTHYVTCRKHHPAHDGNKPHTAEHIARVYHLHRRTDKVTDATPDEETA